MDLAARVPETLLRHRAVQEVELVGSRAAGTAGELSDWDFKVETAGFEAVAEALPELVEPLRPLARQWDRLAESRCYMLMLEGAVKVDLLFDERHEPASPWLVSAWTLPQIDAHFWDWILWLGAKDAAGKHELVEAELEKLSRNILVPLGSERVPSSLEEAVEGYRPAARKAARRLGGVTVSPRLEDEVRTRLRL